MPYEPPSTVGQLVSLVQAVTNLSRPTTTAEVIQALNYGTRKFAKAILSVRPQFFVSFQDPFVMQQGVAEYDISLFTPPLFRVVRLVAPNLTTPVLTFRYKALMDPEYEARDGATAGSFSHLFYDILIGNLPGVPQQATAYDTPSRTITFGADVSAVFSRGSIVEIGNAGDPISLSTSVLNDLYRGVVTAVVGNTIIVDPAVTVVDPTLWDPYPANPTPVPSAVVPMRRKVLRFAPTPPATYVGRLYYNSEPTRLSSVGQLIDAWMADFEDGIVAYAIAHLFRGTGDADTDRWLAQADAMRAEAMQHMEPLSGQNSEYFSSGLPDD